MGESLQDFGSTPPLHGGGPGLVAPGVVRGFLYTLPLTFACRKGRQSHSLRRCGILEFPQRLECFYGSSLGGDFRWLNRWPRGMDPPTGAARCVVFWRIVTTFSSAATSRDFCGLELGNSSHVTGIRRGRGFHLLSARPVRAFA
jgi:hypothetical protein